MGKKTSVSHITDQDLRGKRDGVERWLSDPIVRKRGQFCARTTGNGKWRFYFRYTGPDGKQARVAIGFYDPTGKQGLNLAAARNEAGKLSLLYQEHRDLKAHLEAEQNLKAAQVAAETARLEAERRMIESERAATEARLEAERRAAEAEAARLTVEELFGRWETQRLSLRKDGKEIRRIFAKDVFPTIGHLPAHTIRKGHIVEITDRIEQRKANRLAKITLTSLKAMFKFALMRDYVEFDPTATISKSDVGGKDVERDRVLTTDEIGLLAKQIPTANLTPKSTAAVWIVLSTGCRIGELLKARWEHIDLKKRHWLIPSENSKNANSLEVYLSDFALEQFKTLQQHHHTAWLYTARWRDKETGKAPDKHVCVKTITKQIGDRQKSLIKKKGTKCKGTLALPGGLWTMHDLRRTASTIMGSLGIRPEVIDRCLNHKEPNKITRTYQRYSYKSEMEEAWTLLGARLEALTSGQEAAKVIPLTRGA